MCKFNGKRVGRKADKRSGVVVRLGVMEMDLGQRWEAFPVPVRVGVALAPLASASFDGRRLELNWRSL